MSKIQEALQKLQKGTPPALEKSGRPGRHDKHSPESVVSLNRPFDGERHHVDKPELMRGGLLAPPDQALPIADEFRRIKRPLLDNVSKFRETGGDNLNLILVTSAHTGAGKTFCSVNLAVSLSLERELNVLLIDADVAKRHISNAFGLAEHAGLIDLLEEEALSIEDVLVRTDLNDIQVLPAGRKHAQATELLASSRMENLMGELATRYPDRIIIMDSPPLLMTSEAQALAAQAGQVVLVLVCGKSGHHEIDDVIELLDQSKPINAILNKNIYAQPGGYYGGSYGHYRLNEPEQD